MTVLPQIAEDIYVRINYPSISIVQEYRTWNVEGMLQTIRERHPAATIEQIDHPTYIKELNRATHRD